MTVKSFYDIWVEFTINIVGNNAPTIIYAFSFILFIILFFSCFLGIIKLLFIFFKRY